MITLDSIELKNASPETIGELLIEAKRAYYTGGKPVMDDHTYDTLEEILRQKLPYHRVFTKIGTNQFNPGFDKKKHLISMGSQNKVNNFKDLIRYFELKEKLLLKENSAHSFLSPSKPEPIFCVQPKCDGISLEIIYQNGKLVEAITRGDGQIGDVVTQNIVKMKNMVMDLPKHLTVSVRCEIVMLNKDFKALNKLLKTEDYSFSKEKEVSNQGKEFYSNSRNAASGISQRLDGKYAEYCTLYAVDLVKTLNNDQPLIQTEKEKIDLLKELGFTPVDNFLCQNFNQIEKIYQQFLSKNRKEYPYEIDGLVVKINSLYFQKLLGQKNNRPKSQVAYKFPSQSSQTRIIDVQWQVGPMGTITPVAQVDPIEISGAIINYASLANYSLIVEKNINLNDIVEIQRRGDVIPHIEKVVIKTTPGHLLAPTSCPSCNTKIIKENKFLKCPNIQNCQAQILGSLKLFCDNLKIKGISDKTIAKLYETKRIRLPGDFYHLTISDFENLIGLGQKSGSNIIREIQSKKILSLKQVLNSATIPNFSSQRITQIINAGFNTPKKILNLTVSQLEALPGLQITLAQKIYLGIQSRLDFIKSILNNTKILPTKTLPTSHQLFLNKSFAITGTLSVPRKQLEEKITTLGGKTSNVVNSKTDYLITNDQNSNSSKLVSAKKLNIKIITENEFGQLANK